MYREFSQLNLTQIAAEVLEKWKQENTFEKSIAVREGAPTFTFYEGPPSANGMPGIHHVMARAIKDIFCRYKTIKGFQVHRKGGWDTHGLPIEISVEKSLGITKDDIGKTISVEDYNKACRKEVMKYKEKWDELTQLMGYWVDLNDPYITFENSYIESCWYLLSELYKKGLLYKGYTIQPYSPAAGTGLSSHELNQPGTYRDVKDTSIVAQFKIEIGSWKLEAGNKNTVDSPLTTHHSPSDIFLLAWTTTPWTLPSNSALAVGENITYVLVHTFNQYTFQPIQVILAKDLLNKYFPEKNADLKFEDYKEGDKHVPFKVITEFKGKDLIGTKYEQLMPYVKPDGKAFEIIAGDFVSTEDGTGIVHIAPTFGADDMRVAKAAGIASALVKDENNNDMPLVDKRGRFVNAVTDFANEPVKEEYLSFDEKEEWRIKQNRDKYLNVDERIAIKLKTENKAFKVEKYEHSYPHCWRTDKPVLYYPLDSWFIKTTACKERMIALNKTINWKPESTGTGRFGNWLENLVDWNLSRSRFWGIPLPIWRSDDGDEKCIGTVAELKSEIEKSIAAGFMDAKHLEHVDVTKPDFDLHRPYVDNIILVSDSGKPMTRETDLIDVWFDSGAMPYAQWHYGPPAPKGGENTEEEIIYRWKNANPALYSKLMVFAKQNRSEPTKAEELLWMHLSGKQMDNYKFRRQHIIEDVIVDFVCIKKRLVIEVDGQYHSNEKQKESDTIREDFLKDLGYTIIRFSNDEVLNNIENTLAKIKLKLAHLPVIDPRKGLNPPFGGKGAGAHAFPADFIAEGVDQTRGWFFTLHAIAVMLFDSVAFKNVVSNGLVLDKSGNKMSKRLGNAVDPFETLGKYGPDATRWYMISNAQPWDNLKFNLEGIAEVQRKFFGTLYNTYAFFALYANIDGFEIDEKNIVPVSQRQELDRWIISKLQNLIKEVDESLADYEPTKAARAMEEFVDAHLSNWYVRLSRRRFWRNEMTNDKKAAYETLYECLMVLTQLASPIAPFFSDWLYRNLSDGIRKKAIEQNTPLRFDSVHHSLMTSNDLSLIDTDLEDRMQLAQDICSLTFSLRKKVNIRVRQPLQKLLIPAIDDNFKRQVEAVKHIILAEVNVKEIEFVSDDSGLLKKKAKANFKTLGKKAGAQMKALASAIQDLTQEQIRTLEKEGIYNLTLNQASFELLAEDVEVLSEDIPGWQVASTGRLTVALDINITEKLREEGIARELVNRLQNLRKDKGLEVTDKINVTIKSHPLLTSSVVSNKNYICAEILAASLEMVENIDFEEASTVEIDESLIIQTIIKKA